MSSHFTKENRRSGRSRDGREEHQVLLEVDGRLPGIILTPIPLELVPKWRARELLGISLPRGAANATAVVGVRMR